jgi:hypothetical protein
LIGGYKNQNGDINSRLKYTLDSVVGSEASHFESDFKVGGWNGYNAYTQNPANNPFQALFIASDEAAKVVQQSKSATDKEITQGNGFLNQRQCVAYRTGPPNQPPVDPIDANCIQWKTTSPGSVVESQINTALGSKFEQSALGAALGNSISSIVNALTTQLLNKGLTALSTAIQGNGNNTQQAWQYNGQTLDTSNTADANNPANWSLADQENNLNELFYTGVDIGIADENGNPQKLTLLEQAQLEADAYKKILDLMHGVRQSNSPIFCAAHPTDPSCVVIPQKSFSEAIMDLDYAVPGPKFHWQQRLNDSMQNGIQKWSQRAASRKNEKLQQKAQNILEWLQDAADSIPTDIGLQILTTDIPSYDEAQSLIQTGVAYNNKEREYSDNYATTLAAIARLQHIKQYQLDPILLYQSDPSTVTHTQVDTSLQQWIANNPQSQTTLDQTHLGNYPRPSGCPPLVVGQPLPQPCSALQANGQSDWQNVLNNPPLVNPFNYLKTVGQQSLKTAIKAYSLIYQDLPNSGTISSAQNDAERIRAEYVNIGAMKTKVLQEVSDHTPDNIYLVEYGDDSRPHDFIHPSGDPTVVKKITADTVHQTFNGCDSGCLNGHSYIEAVQDLMNYGFITLDHYSDINIHIKRMLISSLGGSISSTIAGQNSGGGQNGWDQVQLVTNVDRTHILAILNASPWQDSNNQLDQAHTDILNGLTDQELTLMYSLVVTTLPIDLGTPAWDPNSTGLTRLTEALDVIGDADLGFQTSANADNTPDTAGRIFFCQSIMDNHDNYNDDYRGTFKSLFKRVHLNCNKIYDSHTSDYKASVL